ncbi:MAG: hypothetical protein HC923_09185 [Myxococcales bacterium]|nr:hypothetical protein [Myxococcales bacterium]
MTPNGPARVPICQPRRASPSLVLGPVTTSSIGSSETIVFDVPPSLAGFVVVLRAEGSSRVGIRKLISPDGTAVIDTSDEAPDAVPTTPYFEASSIIVPSSESVPPSQGRWELQLATFRPAITEALEPLAGSSTPWRSFSSQPATLEASSTCTWLSRARSA